MPGPDFLDTNILVYAYDPSERAKQLVAQDLLRRALSGHGVISTQVLAEFASTLLDKVSPPADAAQVVQALDALAPIVTISPDSGLVRRAVEVRAEYGLPFYDGMIVAAAERAGAEIIWSEDLNAGQQYFGVTVRNPFKPQ
jgi:predicted nucleic acid-binding protein